MTLITKPILAKHCRIALAATLLCLMVLPCVQAQTASNSPGSPTTQPSANRFSSTPAVGASSPVVPKTAVLATRKDAASDQWLSLALAAFLSLRYLMWIGIYAVIFYVLSYGLAQMMYRSHLPQSAHGAAKWSVFWALLICGMLPLLLPFIFPYALVWSWIAWLLVSFPFTLLMLILLVTLLASRPVRA